MFEIDWQALFIPTDSLAEIFVRGSIVYLALFAAMRLLPKREVGGMGAADILVIVLIADAVQNAMSGSYESISEGLVLAVTIFGWATLIDWIDYRFPQLHLAESRPRLIIRDGRLMHENMKRDMVSEDEVMSQLRQHGLDSPADVAKAYIEGDGNFSVLRRGKRPVQTTQPPQRGTTG